MRRQGSLMVLVALLVVLAGCSTVNLSGFGSSAPAPTPTSAPTPTATPTQTPRSTQSWIPPIPPNRPTDVKGDSRRISRVEFVHTEQAADGTGYADFDLRVHADTRMPNVDPKSHGTVQGEPYFLVAIEDKLVARTNQVLSAESVFSIAVHPGALDQYEAGTLNVTVYLMDEDSQYDDQYGVWNGTVEYDPG